VEDGGGTKTSRASGSLISRFMLTVPIKIAIIVLTLSTLFITAGNDIQRYGPILFYLYGSLPFAYILTYLRTGKRIYEENSTNVGVANSYNTAGMLVGTLTVVGEISKGVLPLIVSFLWFNYSLEVSVYLIIGSLLGTNFSIFIGFRGGMGTTMMLWSFLFLSPLVLLAILILMLVLLKVMKNSYHVALLVYGLAPVLALVLDGRLMLVILATYAAVLYIIKLKPEMNDFEYGYGMKMMMRKRSTDRPPQGPNTQGP
jgi:glycerol-3-phosphate acyltransferase PlsY